MARRPREGSGLSPWSRPLPHLPRVACHRPRRHPRARSSAHPACLPREAVARLVAASAAFPLLLILLTRQRLRRGRQIAAVMLLGIAPERAIPLLGLSPRCRPEVALVA